MKTTGKSFRRMTRHAAAADECGDDEMWMFSTAEWDVFVRSA